MLNSEMIRAYLTYSLCKLEPKFSPQSDEQYFWREVHNEFAKVYNKEAAAHPAEGRPDTIDLLP